MLDTKRLVTLDDSLLFDIGYEKTRLPTKKYVMNKDTDTPIGIVGNSFNTTSHREFIDGVEKVIKENRTPYELFDAKVKVSTAKDNAVIIADITLPNVTTKITTDVHETTIAERIIALHGVDGSMSNQVFFGAIDFFCTNGQIRGEYDKVRRKNTSRFSIDTFINELQNAKQDFYAQSKKLQAWANIKLDGVDVADIIKGIVKSDRKAEKMNALYQHEVTNRGKNVFALYSAFTNYSSYADDKNGFKLKEMGNDTESLSMWAREQEVSKWISSNEFKKLELVA
jgi:hypothetical protein